MLEEPAEDQVAPLESIGEEEPRLREDQDEPESEEEPRSSVYSLDFVKPSSGFHPVIWERITH